MTQADLPREVISGAKHLYARVSSLYRPPLSIGLGIDEGCFDPLPPAESVWWIDGGDTPAAPYSGGAVYYLLWSVRRVVVSTDQTLSGLPVGAAKRDWDAFVFSLRRLPVAHDDMRHCWYVCAPYVSKWRWDAEQRLDWLADRRERRRAREGLRDVACAAAPPPQTHRALYERAWARLLRSPTARLLGAPTSRLSAACHGYVAALDGLAGLRRPRVADAFVALNRLEYAGNELCAASAQLLGPLFEAAVARLKERGWAGDRPEPARPAHARPRKPKTGDR